MDNNRVIINAEIQRRRLRIIVFVGVHIFAVCNIYFFDL